MNHLETQAFNEWIAYLKSGTIQPSALEAQCFIVLFKLSTSYADLTALAEAWLNQAVESGVLVVNLHPYKLKEGH